MEAIQISLSEKQLRQSLHKHATLKYGKFSFTETITSTYVKN